MVRSCGAPSPTEVLHLGASGCLRVMTGAPRVLITRSGPMPDGSARPQPPSCQWSWLGACASVSIAKTQPIPAARHSTRAA